MKRRFLALAAVTALNGAAFAQTAPQPTPAPPPARSSAPSAGAHSRIAPKPHAKEARAQCRADAASQGLRGAALKGYVKECFAKARPDLAAAAQCRAQGKAQGLSGDDLKAFARKCKKGG
jgi:hypothetical protein